MIKNAWILYLLLALGVSAVVTSDINPDVLMKVRGDSVTLNTGVNEYYLIIWMFGPELSRIAQCSASPSCETFRDGLQIDRETGSLTINNLRDEHAGDYTLQIFDKKHTKEQKTFTLIISPPLPVPEILRAAESSCGRCVLLCSALNVSDASLSWLRGSDVISSVRVSGLNSSVRLQISDGDSRSYSCVLNNTISKQATYISTQLCPPCSGSAGGAVIGVVVVVVVVPAIIGSVIYCIRRRSRRTRRKGEEEEQDGYKDEASVVIFEKNSINQSLFPELLKNNDTAEHSGLLITDLDHFSSGASKSEAAASC